MKKSLSDLKIAPFYGCHMLRPSSHYGFENAMKPTSMNLLADYFLDGKVIDYGSKALCCGYHTLLTEQKASLKAIGNNLKDAVDSGAECVVTPCTQCMVALDVYQADASKEIKKEFEMPILHLSQLVGLALGISKEDLGLDKNVVSPTDLLEKKGL